MIDECPKNVRFINDFGQYKWVVGGDELIVTSNIEVESGARESHALMYEVVESLWVGAVARAGVIICDVEAVKVHFMISMIGEELGYREGESGGVDKIA